jgi:hypothetical protein
MAFTSLDDMLSELASGKQYRADWAKVVAEVQAAGNAYDLSVLIGNPPANTYPGTALNSVAPSESTGWGIYHGGNVTSDVKNVLHAMALSGGATSAPGMLHLVDVALYYPGIDLKSATIQNMVQSASLARYTDGKGLRPYCVVTTRSGNPTGTPVLSNFNYRNQADTDAALSAGTINFMTGGTAIPPVSKIVHASPQTLNPGPWLPLNAGDTGIKRINSWTTSTAYGGATTLTGCLVLAKPILSIGLAGVGIPGEYSFYAPAPILPIIPDGACLSWVYVAGAATAAGSVLQGGLHLGWG